MNTAAVNSAGNLELYPAELPEPDLDPDPTPDPKAPFLAIPVGTRIQAQDGTLYVAAGVTLRPVVFLSADGNTVERRVLQNVTIRRAYPKVRGKAARKADKRARRDARALPTKFVDIDWTVGE